MNKFKDPVYRREYMRTYRQQQREAEAEPRETRHAVGDPVAWVPAAFESFKDPQAMLRLNGRVVYVHKAHRYYTAEAECHGYRLRESFKF